jgi:hypothetical protein
MTYTGNPTYNIYNNLVPYIDLDGTGDYLARADETDLDILGTEAINASSVRGLTLGGWFWFDALSGGTARGIIGKNVVTGNQRSYVIFITVADVFQFAVSVDGTATTTVNSTVTPATGQWYFMVGRFIPSTEISIFVNGTETPNTTSIPASIFNSTAAFEIGRFLANNANVIDGRATFCFLSMNALPDAWIFSLFEQSRVLFGV